MPQLDLGKVVGDTGPQGPKGDQGIQGPAGQTGPGVAVGGSANQVLVKHSGTNYDTQWVDAGNLPSIAGVQDAVAIVANGDTHPAIASGQFVYVRNHSTLAEGLYKATAAIGTDVALTTSNLTADGSGGLNDLKGQIDSLNSNIICTEQSELLNGSIAQSSDTSWHNTSGSITIPANAKYLVLNVEPNGAMRQSLVIPVIMLRLSPLDYYVNNYWDANDLGYLRIDRNGTYFVGAKTQNMKFNYSIYEIH